MVSRAWPLGSARLFQHHGALAVDALEKVIIAIASLIGGGGLVRLYQIWSERRKGDHEWISGQYQLLLQVREDESAALRADKIKLERRVEKLEDKLTAAYAEILKLGGTWPHE